MPCHRVTAGTDAEAMRTRQRSAHESLEQAGFEVHASIASGAAETANADAVKVDPIDVLVMGAYRHARIRQFIVGSATTAMLLRCTIPVLLFREGNNGNDLARESPPLHALSRVHVGHQSWDEPMCIVMDRIMVFGMSRV